MANNTNLNDEQTADILESVYRNARLAYKATFDVQKRCQNNELYEELAKEQNRYKQVASRARHELSKLGEAAYEASPHIRTMVKTGIAMKTAVNSDTGSLAEIMYKGTNMGIVDMQRTLNRSRSADGNIRASAEKLLEREQEFCENLRRFL
ncbi:MAG: hypothetical protein K2J80_09580 [Oscillospiraceae bacterium]|nr:hypothetical protein [Oscillospiraceae bacterium]